MRILQMLQNALQNASYGASSPQNLNLEFRKRACHLASLGFTLFFAHHISVCYYCFADKSCPTFMFYFIFSLLLTPEYSKVLGSGDARLPTRRWSLGTTKPEGSDCELAEKLDEATANEIVSYDFNTLRGKLQDGSITAEQALQAYWRKAFKATKTSTASSTLSSRLTTTLWNLTGNT
ncbi:hypothetical protein L596_005543 [Steinernema carpocapsae]|uniref:Uncharacterized protein n=1 Tax=Steinernema carpocapsae TaxID=34508 RepID=A0A4U8UZF0_STECR|nr:hypothetical protein L596_005543 [Steinernema carpocapsae]